MSMNFAHGYALLIGVDESMAAGAALPDVKKDIEALQAILARPERCGYPAGQVKVVTGVAATRHGILDGWGGYRRRWRRMRVRTRRRLSITVVMAGGRRMGMIIT